MSWVCPKCKRELRHENAAHYCIKVSIGTLFAGKDDEQLLIFDKILAEVADWENVLVSTSKNCIVFVHKQTFLVIKPMKAALDVKFYSTIEVKHPLIIKSHLYSGRYANNMRLTKIEQLAPQLFKYFRVSYGLL